MNKHIKSAGEGRISLQTCHSCNNHLLPFAESEDRRAGRWELALLFMCLHLIGIFRDHAW